MASLERANQFLALLNERQELSPEAAKEQGTLAAFLEGTIHETFTTMADKLFRLGLMNREERINLSGAIGDALAAFRKRIDESAPGLAKTPLDPEIAKKIVLKE